MRPKFEVDRPRRPPPSDLHVLRVVLPHRYALVEKIRQPQESVPDFPREFVDLAVQGGDLFRQGGGFLPQFIGVLPRLLGLGNVLRDLVPTTLQGVPFRESLPPLLVPLNQGVEDFLLVRRVALGQILADDLRVLPDEPDVEHAATRCEGAYL